MNKVAANWAKIKRRQACLWSLDWEFGPILGPFAFGLDLIFPFCLEPKGMGYIFYRLLSI